MAGHHVHADGCWGSGEAAGQIDLRLLQRQGLSPWLQLVTLPRLRNLHAKCCPCSASCCLQRKQRACCAKHWDTWYGLRPAQLCSACCRYRQDVSGLQVGLDIDPFALKASEDNAALNGVQESMTVLPTTAKLVVSGQCQVSRVTAEAPARPHVYV